MHINSPQSCASLVLSPPSFLNRRLPVLAGPYLALPLSHLNLRFSIGLEADNFKCSIQRFMLVRNLRILMSQWVEPAERLRLFLGSSLPLNVWKLKTDT